MAARGSNASFSVGLQSRTLKATGNESPAAQRAAFLAAAARTVGKLPHHTPAGTTAKAEEQVDGRGTAGAASARLSQYLVRALREFVRRSDTRTTQTCHTHLFVAVIGDERD